MHEELIKSAHALLRSGRVGTCLERVREMIHSGKDNHGKDQKVWFIVLLSGLLNGLMHNYITLDNEYEKPPTGNSDISLLAWRARNILELSMWVSYCLKHEDFAETFCRDAGRDGFDWFSVMEKMANLCERLGQAVIAEREQLKIGKQVLTSDGFESFAEPYTRVHDAAMELGRDYGEGFSLINKFLSKWAHPTAILVMSQPIKDERKQLCDTFTAIGAGFFVAGIESVEQHFT